MHIIVQTAKTQVLPLYFDSTSNFIGIHGSGRGLSYSLPSAFLFLSPIDTTIAYGVDLRSLDLSELDFNNWLVFLAFYNSYAN